jgi:Flp pilus assembly protein TadG
VSWSERTMSRALCRQVLRCGRRRCDTGAAIIEFALVSVVLVFLLFAVLQVAVYAYIRHVVIADAANAARYAAASGVSVEAAIPRANALISSHLGAAAAHDLKCVASQTVDGASGLMLVSVQCHGPIRSLFLPVGTFLNLDISTSALKEPMS